MEKIAQLAPLGSRQGMFAGSCSMVEAGDDIVTADDDDAAAEALCEPGPIT